MALWMLDPASGRDDGGGRERGMSWKGARDCAGRGTWDDVGVRGGIERGSAPR